MVVAKDETQRSNKTGRLSANSLFILSCPGKREPKSRTFRKDSPFPSTPWCNCLSGRARDAAAHGLDGSTAPVRLVRSENLNRGICSAEPSTAFAPNALFQLPATSKTGAYKMAVKESFRSSRVNSRGEYGKAWGIRDETMPKKPRAISLR
jgi:hypothetical protein